MAYTQHERSMAIHTPLGRDVLLLAGLSGTEGLSRLFSFDLTLFSENSSISFEEIIGKNVTISMILPDDSERYFNGIVSYFSQKAAAGEENPDLSSYQATIVPWLWLLGKTTDSRIFQNLSAPDIIEKIFSEKEFTDYRLELGGNHPQRDYCVQYRETDLDFVSRLMEEEGIYYYFEHDRGKHTLVLVDSSGRHKPCPHQEEASMLFETVASKDQDYITTLEKRMLVQAGKYTLNDFNFKMPNTDLQVSVPARKKVGPQEREFYDYPGNYETQSDGDRLTRLLMEEQEARVTTLLGSSSCKAFGSGYHFRLVGCNIESMNEKEYLLTSLGHGAWQSGYDSGTSSEQARAAFSYTNNFSCIPMDVQYRPRRTTAKPVVQGAQTAIVVGPPGEEIYTDEHGRVKVQFHWDREGKKDDKSSCWIRVSQLWAGANWGAMYIPRIDQEVIVDFLEGDPDRPIITGRVYHGINKPPYPLPDEKTKSTIKSDSSPGGVGFNEFRFEDMKGDEEVYLHAERNNSIEVKADENHTIGGNHTITIDMDDSKTVKGKQEVQIMGQQDITVMGAVTVNCLQGATVTFGPSGLTVSSAGPISITAPSVTISAGSITLATPLVQVAGIVQCTTLIASAAVVSPTYSPGVGNIV
ncbi:MAG: type VI secretion system Vgr family protein [Syntrophobacteraceae bacterium]